MSKQVYESHIYGLFWCFGVLDGLKLNIRLKHIVHFTMTETHTYIYIMSLGQNNKTYSKNGETGVF